jgi:thioredoxin-related protein
MLSRRRILVLVVVWALLGTAGAEWQTDYGKALAKAKAEHKKVLLDFTGSDWCPPCIELRRRVFSRPEFRAYADKNLMVIEIDYPLHKQQSADLKKQNERLAGQYRIDEKGFPTVILLDPEGKMMREFTNYGGESVADVIAWIEGRRRL